MSLIKINQERFFRKAFRASTKDYALRLRLPFWTLSGSPHADDLNRSLYQRSSHLVAKRLYKQGREITRSKFAVRLNWTYFGTGPRIAHWRKVGSDAVFSRRALSCWHCNYTIWSEIRARLQQSSLQVLAPNAQIPRQSAWRKSSLKKVCLFY